MKKALTLMLAALTALGLAESCDDAGCTLYNSTNCHLVFYDNNGNVTPLAQYLTVNAKGASQVVLNKGVGYKELKLQLSYTNDVDTLLWEHWTTTTTVHTETDDEGNETTTEVQEDSPHVVDTLYIRKTNFPHFESPDCGTAVFHDIQEVWYGNDSRYPNQGLFESTYLNHEQVYYNSSDNIRLIINQ